MSVNDWSNLVGSLGPTSVVQGLTGSQLAAPGGGQFVYGMNAVGKQAGVAAKFLSVDGFNPMDLGGRISGAIKRRSRLSGDMAAFFFLGLRGFAVQDDAYMLGLAGDDFSHIVLRKGSIREGLPGGNDGSNGILARSEARFPDDAWLHLCLELVVARPATVSDVVLNVYQSELGQHPVTDPHWVKIAGMSDCRNGLPATAFIDDMFGVNSGSLPLGGGRAGFGVHVSTAAQSAFWDHIKISKQLVPI